MLQKLIRLGVDDCGPIPGQLIINRTINARVVGWIYHSIELESNVMESLHHFYLPNTPVQSNINLFTSRRKGRADSELLPFSPDSPKRNLDRSIQFRIWLNMFESRALNGHFFHILIQFWRGAGGGKLCAFFVLCRKAVKTILFGIFLVINHVFRMLFNGWKRKWYNRRQKVFNIIFTPFEPMAVCVWENVFLWSDCNMWNLSHNWVISPVATQKLGNWFWYFVVFFDGDFLLSSPSFVQVKISKIFY